MWYFSPGQRGWGWGGQRDREEGQTEGGVPFSSALPSVSWVSPTDVAGAIASRGGAAGWDGWRLEQCFNTGNGAFFFLFAKAASTTAGNKSRIKEWDKQSNQSNKHAKWTHLSHKCTCTKIWLPPPPDTHNAWMQVASGRREHHIVCRSSSLAYILLLWVIRIGRDLL